MPGRLEDGEAGHESKHRTRSRGTSKTNFNKEGHQKYSLGPARWLTPVIPALWEAEGRIMRLGNRDHPGQHGETLSLLKIQKISWMLGYMPVLPATWEAEAGESLEPGRRRLQWAEIAPLYSSLGNKSSTLFQKKNCQTVFQSGYIIFHSHQKCMQVPGPLHRC